MKKILILMSIAIFSFASGGRASIVNTTIIEKGTVNALEEFIGTLKFSKSSKIAAQISGAVVKVYFESGDVIKKGAILVKIDSEVLDSQIKSAIALLEIAKITLNNSLKDYDRYKKLIARKSISQKLYDDSFFKMNSAKQNLNSAKASLEQLSIEKKKKLIKAPFSGVIVQKHTEVSEWLHTGNVVATLVDTKNIDLIFNLPTSYLYKLDKKKTYQISIGESEINTKFYAFIAKGDKLTRTFPIKFKAKLQNTFVYEGMQAKIQLPRNKQIESFIVPRDAVIKRFGQNIIFIVNEKSQAVMKPVNIVGYKGLDLAIEAKGLSVGMNVVTKGNERIFPNQALKIINK